MHGLALNMRRAREQFAPDLSVSRRCLKALIAKRCGLDMFSALPSVRLTHLAKPRSTSQHRRQIAVHFADQLEVPRASRFPERPKPALDSPRSPPLQHRVSHPALPDPRSRDPVSPFAPSSYAVRRVMRTCSIMLDIVRKTSKIESYRQKQERLATY